MNALNTLFSERNQILDVLHAASQGAGTVNGNWVKADRHERIVCIADVGVISASGTFDLKLQQANTSGGGGAKDITGKAITQLTQAGGGSSKVVIIELDVAKMDIANGFFWVRFVLTEATAAALCAVLLLGVDPIYAPVPQTNWAQVV